MVTNVFEAPEHAKCDYKDNKRSLYKQLMSRQSFFHVREIFFDRTDWCKGALWESELLA